MFRIFIQIFLIIKNSLIICYLTQRVTSYNLVRNVDWFKLPHNSLAHQDEIISSNLRIVKVVTFLAVI